MNYIHLHPPMYPHLLEESRRQLEREYELQRQIRKLRAERRAAGPSRLATLSSRVRRVLSPGSRPAPGARSGATVGESA